MKEVIFGITGSIAAYKSIDVISSLKKKDVGITCVVTDNAKMFVTTKTLETISKRPVIEKLFPENVPAWDVMHVSLADKADLLVIAPATANIIAKIASGIADDFLTTCALTIKSNILMVPAMNEAMYNNPITQENIKKLKDRGIEFLDPEKGMLACGKEGIGKFPNRQIILDKIFQKLNIK